jgi:4-hydroxy-2-oxoheptanedioate aldolase
MENLKQRLYAGEAVHGCWINLGSTVSAEMIGRAGFDWVLIDLEHGAGNDAIMYQQLQVLEGVVPAMIRTDQLSRSRVQRILDAGGGGIMFPQLQLPREVEQAVSLMYYPPLGTRGMAKMIRATAFGKNAADYLQHQETRLICIIQIETIKALEDIDAIAALRGVDVLFVGPSDLSMALGIFGQLHHPLYQQAVRDVSDAARKHGKIAGVLLQDINEYEMYYPLGYRFLACGSESAFLVRGAGDMVRQLDERRKRSL